MGGILKLIGSAVVVVALLGKVAGAISNRFQYNYLPIKLKDIRVAIIDGVISGILNVKVQVVNNLGVGVTITSYQAVLYQSGQRIATVNTTTPISIPSKEPTILAADVAISAKDFLDRVRNFTGISDALAPIEIKGEIYFLDGYALPLNQRVQLLSVG